MLLHAFTSARPRLSVPEIVCCPVIPGGESVKLKNIDAPEMVHLFLSARAGGEEIGLYPENLAAGQRQPERLSSYLTRGGAAGDEPISRCQRSILLNRKGGPSAHFSIKPFHLSFGCIAEKSGCDLHQLAGSDGLL